MEYWDIYDKDRNLTGRTMKKNREFDTCKLTTQSKHIEITPFSVYFFVKFIDFGSACLCLLWYNIYIRLGGIFYVC